VAVASDPDRLNIPSILHVTPRHWLQTATTCVTLK
jgi:hypothetical protein